MYMTPAVNAEEYYLELGATQTGNVEEAYDDIIVGEAATNVQVQKASNGYSYKGSTKGPLATTEVEKLEKVLRAEILTARRMRLFMLTVIIVTFVIAVAALILVIMKTADGEGSAAPKQETKAQGKRIYKLFSRGKSLAFDFIRQLGMHAPNGEIVFFNQINKN